MASAPQEPGLSWPSAKPIALNSAVTIQPPLSRRGQGPGLLLIVPKDYAVRDLANASKTLDPEPLQKWAEEGFAVAQVTVETRSGEKLLGSADCDTAVEALAELPQCTLNNEVGVIIYGFSSPTGPTKEVWNWLGRSWLASAVVAFANELGSDAPVAPLMVHSTCQLACLQKPDILHTYDAAASTNFVLPGHPHYEAGPAGVAHSRSLGFLKKHLGGPHFDLEAIWDEHCLFEFGERSVDKTMATMVEEPYVNHVPTMTGGVGRAALTDFYRHHFIFNNPEDTRLELLSRTTGVDRVIDEFIFSFTHDRVIDWLIPGVPPTQKHVRIPFTSIVNIRGDRLYHEHISWDQASVLRQLGLLPEYLPYPYPLPDGRAPALGKRFEYRVPAAGTEIATKLVDENSVPSNKMLGFEIREVNDV
ncbi:unnamed protein product [Diplocarpon coronariae]